MSVRCCGWRSPRIRLMPLLLGFTSPWRRGVCLPAFSAGHYWASRAKNWSRPDNAVRFAPVMVTCFYARDICLSIQAPAIQATVLLVLKSWRLFVEF